MHSNCCVKSDITLFAKYSSKLQGRLNESNCILNTMYTFWSIVILDGMLWNWKEWNGIESVRELQERYPWWRPKEEKSYWSARGKDGQEDRSQDFLPRGQAHHGQGSRKCPLVHLWGMVRKSCMLSTSLQSWHRASKSLSFTWGIPIATAKGMSVVQTSLFTESGCTDEF